MKHLLLFTLTCLFSAPAFAQYTYPIESYNNTSEAFNYLLLPNGVIDKNDTINEKILDLVNPLVMDSVITKKKQHHKVFFVGWLIHAFGGYNWRALSMTKEKFVGTAMRNFHSGKEEYTEYDINFDLNFHTNKYLTRSFYCYDCQKKFHRQDVRRGKHLRDYTKPPFVRDTNEIDISLYRMHCELTPVRAFRAQLHYLFYPTLGGLKLEDHPNFGTPRPCMGFYGVKCLDCNHSCHPEIHPYEWTWWLNLQDSLSTSKKWLLGMFFEGSNRMKKWSLNPKTGSATIPFTMRIKPGIRNEILVDHLVFNTFEEEGLKPMNLTGTLIPTTAEYVTVEASGAADEHYKIYLHFNKALVTNGLKYSFSHLNLDKEKGLLSGYLNMAVSVRDLYTTRVTFTEGVMANQ